MSQSTFKLRYINFFKCSEIKAQPEMHYDEQIQFLFLLFIPIRYNDVIDTVLDISMVITYGIIIPQ